MRYAKRYAAVALFVTLATAAPALAQTTAEKKEFSVSLRAADLLSLREPGGAAAKAKDRFELFRKIMFGEEKAGSTEIIAFEESRLFTYAAGILSPEGGTRRADADQAERLRWGRRILFVRPATVVVDDHVRRPVSGVDVAWVLRTSPDAGFSADRVRHVPRVEDKEKLLVHFLQPKGPELAFSSRDEADYGELRATPKGTAPEIHFLVAMRLLARGESEPKGGWGSDMSSRGARWVKLTGIGGDQAVILDLGPWDQQPGFIKVASSERSASLETRPLASGILPHTPEGLRLLEQWDSAYRGGKRPGWDTGRPSSELVQAVESGKIKPCRTLELGCGLGTNAIYLAGRKFDASALDIAPSALSGAMERAKKAGVSVTWVLADVLAPPKIGPFDFIYDRGCYHGVRRASAAGYVETLRKLTRPGSLVLIEAGNANEARQYGPPRVKEEELRADFSPDFDFVELREAHFDTSDPKAKGALSWFILLRRKGKP